MFEHVSVRVTSETTPPVILNVAVNTALSTGPVTEAAASIRRDPQMLIQVSTQMDRPQEGGFEKHSVVGTFSALHP